MYRDLGGRGSEDGDWGSEWMWRGIRLERSRPHVAGGEWFVR